MRANLHGTFLLVIMGLFFGLPGCKAKENIISESVREICYIPIGVETSRPMTLGNFAGHCELLSGNDHYQAKFSYVLSVVKEAKPGRFENDSIRVKIVLANLKEIYIDNLGGVKIEGSERKLDSIQLRKIVEILNPIFEDILESRG